MPKVSHKKSIKKLKITKLWFTQKAIALTAQRPKNSWRSKMSNSAVLSWTNCPMALKDRKLCRRRLANAPFPIFSSMANTLAETLTSRLSTGRPQFQRDFKTDLKLKKMILLRHIWLMLMRRNKNQVPNSTMIL